jgi:hypothetical protein
MANAQTIAKVEATRYDLWVVQEYNGSYSLIEGWEGNDGTIRPNFCTIENSKTGKEMTIPKGLGGRFDSIDDLMAVLGKLYGKLKRYKEAQEGPPQDDIPF